MKNIFFTLLTAFILFSCTEQVKQELRITNTNDYLKYLKPSAHSFEKIDELNQAVQFWNGKIKTSPNGFIYYQKLGGSYANLFDQTGNVDYLHQADSVFKIAYSLTKGDMKVPNLITLSSLAVQKHDFKSANQYAIKAERLASKKFGALMMQFDSEMELGRYGMAEAILKYNKRMDSFDYLVRLSKFKDHAGDLDSAIVYMEMAQGLVRNEKSERAIWANANLGDMYGHAGRISDSYNKYLEVLDQNPRYSYALRGIAWVAYSADKNLTEAKKIISFLKEKTELPDLDLISAEIAAYEGNVDAEREFIRSFLAEAQKNKYDGMYNKYLIDIFSSDDNFKDDAIRIAKLEVEKRPTPAAYDWMAWAYFQQGDLAKAIGIYEAYVKGKTYEPEVILHMGIVYHNAGEAEGNEYLEESLKAAYELGPVTTRKIKKMLKS